MAILGIFGLEFCFAIKQSQYIAILQNITQHIHLLTLLAVLFLLFTVPLLTAHCSLLTVSLFVF